MYARVVRFTDVAPERIAAIKERVEAEGGPPEGVVSTGLRIMVDEDQGTAVFVGLFDSEENMRKSAEVLEAMDPEQTPGTRASIDMCEVKLDVST